MILQRPNKQNKSLTWFAGVGFVGLGWWVSIPSFYRRPNKLIFQRPKQKPPMISYLEDQHRSLLLYYSAQKVRIGNSRCHVRGKDGSEVLLRCTRNQKNQNQKKTKEPKKSKIKRTNKKKNILSVLLQNIVMSYLEHQRKSSHDFVSIPSTCRRPNKRNENFTWFYNAPISKTKASHDLQGLGL